YMGMGEPMSNYDNVKNSINRILEHTDIGKTHITVSTVGVLPRLEILLNDPQWPHVRLAISLHSADAKTRNELLPSSYDEFLPKLADWGKKYLERFGNNRHHLTFEYVMLKDVNDTPRHAKLLAKFSQSIGNVRVNLIPYNFTECGFQSSTKETIEKFQKTLEEYGVTATARKSHGEDISAACGQLIKK
ncbi:TPA: 23S rRNA (adenine(2503)-C(2))-methyltransferase RlmN, partial [Candidatus Uhrbacteria bacterium]|nr:23S rRNA (adenine(2503)-C(2))-methyltransferase RlmN [Candidatus Uhrbacteria bacterium]